MKPFKLDNHSKIKPGFTVPDGYFETFESRMMQRLAEPSPAARQNEPKIISLHPGRKSWWYAAAAVLVLALAIPAINSLDGTKNQPDAVALDSYFAYGRLSDDQIVEMLDSEDIDKIKIDYKLEDEAIEEALDSGTIENYILD